MIQINKFSFKILFLTSCLFLVAACGEKKEQTGANDLSSKPQAVFETSCSAENSKEQLEISADGNEIKQIKISYDTANEVVGAYTCSGKTLYQEATVYKVEDVEEILVASEKVSVISVQVKSIAYTLFDSSVLGLFNSSSECGYSDWQVKTPKEISGKNCLGGSIPAQGASTTLRTRNPSPGTLDLRLGGDDIPGTIFIRKL